MKNIFFTIIIISFLLYLIQGYFCWFNKDNFKVVFFDVGQGDASLIVTPNGKTILIDGGPDEKVLRGLGEILPFWQRKIDLIIITHAHDDHIIGLIEICKRYKVGEVLYNNLNFKTPAVEFLTIIFKNKKITLTNVRAGMVYKFTNSCLFNILSASKEIEKNENDYSIVANFKCFNKNILFTGDAGLKIEQELLVKNINLKADLLKIAHHGSDTASSETFLKAVNPQAVIISVGLNNKFKHPNWLILERLQKLAVDIYRTDQQGIRYFLANNKSIKLIK
jgi:competence protein ComEC